MFLIGVRWSDIQDRYRFDIGIFCWIGVSSDETDPNSIFCIANIVIVKPHKTQSFRALNFKCSEAVT